MAMLIAWQTVNAARKDSKDFSRAFLIVTPGITIRDRLRVLLPSEPDNYYETREIVPPEMLPQVRRAEIVITNYHSFQHRETLTLPKVARSFLQGNAPEPLRTTQTDAEMLKDACEKLLNYDRVNVINDEAHHCYRHKVGEEAEGALTGDDKKEAAEPRRPPGSGSTASKRWTASCRRVYVRSMTSQPPPSSCVARVMTKAPCSLG
jgi:type III restriction enzyme